MKLLVVKKTNQTPRLKDDKVLTCEFKAFQISSTFPSFFPLVQIFFSFKAECTETSNCKEK